MKNRTGYLPLWRKILDWEWYSDTCTCKLFLHCCLMANIKESKFRGESIRCGEFVTSVQSLAHENGMSVQQVRTSLAKLQKTGEINKRATNSFTVIQVVNFESHSLKQQTSNKRATNEQQQNKKTRSKEDKKLPIGSDAVSEQAAKPPTYGNEHVNFIIDTIKAKTGMKTLDNTVKTNRQSAFRLWKKILAEANGNEQHAQQAITRCIVNGLNDDWHAKRLTSVSYLEKHFQTLFRLTS